SSSSSTTTAFGSSTSDLTRNSNSSVTSRSAARGRDALGAQQGGDRLRRLGAVLEPVTRALLVELDRRGLGLRVVATDRLDRAAVARRALVGDDDPPDRVLLRSDAPQSDSHCH